MHVSTNILQTIKKLRSSEIILIGEVDDNRGLLKVNNMLTFLACSACLIHHRGHLSPSDRISQRYRIALYWMVFESVVYYLTYVDSS